MTETVTLADNMKLISDSWPKLKLNKVQSDEFHAALGGLRQDRLREAIKLAYRDNQKEPRLKTIHAFYSQLTESSTYTPELRINGTMTWHVSWQKTSKHGVPGRWYGCRCQTREEAEHVARENNGRVVCMDPANDEYEYSEESMRADEEKARACIEGLPRETIAGYVTRLRSVGWLRHVTSVKDKLPGRVSDWPRMAVLEVYAEHLNQQERR